MTEPTGDPARRWGYWRVLIYAVLVSVVYVLAQSVVIFVVTLHKASTDPAFDAKAWSAAVGSDGLVFPLCSIVAVAASIPLIRFLAGRREPAPWAFLGVLPCRWRSLLLWCAAMLVFGLLTDLLSLALGRPLVPDLMLEAYRTAPYQSLLLAALVVTAPLVEELFFRGFLLSAFHSLGIRFRVAAVVSSAAWALVHIQYGAYEMAIIFLMGLLLAEARYRSRSILPCMAMHALNNAGSYVETVFLMG